MCSTLDIRNDIVRYKDEYSKTDNKLLLLYSAIYKGMYIALGGKKGIALSTKMSDIVLYSTIIFKYKIKLSNCGNKEHAVNFLLKSMRENFKNPEYYIDGKIPEDNEELSNLLADMIISDNEEDLVINHKNIYNISMELLERI